MIDRLKPNRSVAVFCGSRRGNNPVFAEAADQLGAALAAADIRLVYGGGQIGLMGVLADAVLRTGGQVLGVIPDFLRRLEVAHAGLGELVVTETMHVRKQRMCDEADAFVTMPGGLGTYDETIEIITWRQLGLHDKPILICDIAGAAAPLIAAIEAAIEMGFASPSARGLYEIVDSVEAVMTRLATVKPAAETDAIHLT
jgi:uncharacterized protein (TIGR00730 family)